MVSLQNEDKLNASMQFTVVLTNMKSYINKTANYYFSDSSDLLFMQLYLERQCRFGFLGLFLFVFCFVVFFNVDLFILMDPYRSIFPLLRIKQLFVHNIFFVFPSLFPVVKTLFCILSPPKFLNDVVIKLHQH